MAELVSRRGVELQPGLHAAIVDHPCRPGEQRQPVVDQLRFGHGAAHASQFHAAVAAGAGPLGPEPGRSTAA